MIPKEYDYTYLSKFGPCVEGLNFCKKFKTIKEAYYACERIDWLIWFACVTSTVDSTTLNRASKAMAYWNCSEPSIEHANEIRNIIGEIFE